MHDIVIAGGTILDGSGGTAAFFGSHNRGRRLVQRADGHRATLVASTPTFENDAETGARSGRLVRSAG